MAVSSTHIVDPCAWHVLKGSRADHQKPYAGNWNAGPPVTQPRAKILEVVEPGYLCQTSIKAWAERGVGRSLKMRLDVMITAAQHRGGRVDGVETRVTGRSGEDPSRSEVHTVFQAGVPPVGSGGKRLQDFWGPVSRLSVGGGSLMHRDQD